MRRYSVTMQVISVSVAKDLIRISAPSTMVVCVLRAWLKQRDSETSEQARVVLQRASTDGTGTANTPEKIEVGDPAATLTAVTNLSADTTLTGSPTVDEDFNWLVGWDWVPSELERIWIPPSGRLVMRLPTAPAAALVMTAGLLVMELG